jgi:eukaryotic-like serine/threonine-protein kinase
VSTSQVIDRKYQVVRLLGKGGMGAVYEARHLGTGRRVAVKVILNEDGLPKHVDVLARFQREARAAGAIESMHITQVLDTGIDADAGHPYLVMEYLAGEDLHQTLERLGPLAPDLALRIAFQACLGLAKAHEGGVVHRDIKPANIFLARQDAGQIWVKLLDFGIAKAKMEQFASREQAMLTQTGSIVGSPHYMSPEQATGAKTIDPRTDIWSLGVVLYEALAGRTPFAEKDTLGSLIVAICSEPLPPLQQRAPWVPMEVAALVHRALERDPAARFHSVADMLTATRALLPYGHMVSEEMMAPIPPEARAVVAPTLFLASHQSFAQTWAPDADGDTFGSSTAATVCSVNPPAPTGYVANHTDCCDTDSRAHPLLPLPSLPTDYPGLTVESDGGITGPQTADNCGSFDYDCSGTAVPVYTNLCSISNYGCPATCPDGFSGVSSRTGTCAVCDISTTLPSSCPSGTPPNTGYNTSQPPCGGIANFGSFLCNGGTTCTLEINSDPPLVYQLCF